MALNPNPDTNLVSDEIAQGNRDEGASTMRHGPGHTRDGDKAGARGEIDGDLSVPAGGSDGPDALEDFDDIEAEEQGVDPAELDDEDLIRELASLHRTRMGTLRHGSDSALANHLRRTAELESEYLARTPGREIDPHRLREQG